MERREFPNLRLYILGGFVLLVLLIYLGVLYDIQVNDHEDYLAQSIRTITQPETVEASRGIVTDRNGQVLVSNRSTYSLTFSTSLLKSGEDVNEAILRLVRLCQKQEVAWVDKLPISQTAPFSYTLEGLDSIQRGRFPCPPGPRSVPGYPGTRPFSPRPPGRSAAALRPLRSTLRFLLSARPPP